MTLLLITTIIYVFNIPFGYWRANVKRFSLQWFLAIHLPVPFIILLRLFSEIGFEPVTYIAFISAFFLGQITGLKIFEKMKLNNSLTLTSCLVMDMIRLRNSNR